MYTDAKIHGLAEVSGDRPIRDFLLAVYSKNPAYSTSQQNFQDLHPRTMDQIIEHYRQYLRLYSAAKKGGDHSAFAANQSFTRKPNQTGSQGTSNSTYQGNQMPTPRCICGKVHLFPDCFYLNPKKQRPSSWTENLETRQKVDEALKDTVLKGKVQSSLAKRLAAEARQAEQRPQSGTNKPETPTTSSTTSGKVFSTSLKFNDPKSLSLREAFILDTGADIHVCNSSMLHCYIKQTDAHPDDKIEAGTDCISV